MISLRINVLLGEGMRPIICDFGAAVDWELLEQNQPSLSPQQRLRYLDACFRKDVQGLLFVLCVRHLNNYDRNAHLWMISLLACTRSYSSWNLVQGTSQQCRHAARAGRIGVGHRWLPRMAFLQARDFSTRKQSHSLSSPTPLPMHRS